MSDQVKGRLLVILLWLVFVGINIGHWVYRIQTSSFYPMISLFAPIGLVLFLLFALFPSLLAQPRAKKEEFIVSAATILGLILGAANWYVMANGF
jgi:hypothetical protein